MKKDFWESILFLIVGNLTMFHGADNLIDIDYQNASVWKIAGSLIQIVAGLMVAIFGITGIKQSRKS